MSTVLVATAELRVGNAVPMDGDRAQLSSVASALDELTQRITQLADESQRGTDDQLAAELYEIERALQQAARRLDRLVREPPNGVRDRHPNE